MNQFYYLLLCMRPKQWIKNFIIFVPLVFSGHFLNLRVLEITTIIFLLFSIFVGTTYIFNDYKDISKDKKHPKKQYRPLASGKLNTNFALSIGLLILILTLILLYFFGGIAILILILIYFINTLLYTLYIKHIEILDVFSIAVGFVIRGLIGAFAISVGVSIWLLIMLFFGALLLGFLKRYQEVKLATESRSVIKKYSGHFLEQILSILTTTVLISYALYTFSSIHSKLMIITIPFVAFGIFRFYYNIFYLEKYKENIENIILGDKFIVIDIIIFVIIVISIILLEKSGIDLTKNIFDITLMV